MGEHRRSSFMRAANLPCLRESLMPLHTIRSSLLSTSGSTSIKNRTAHVKHSLLHTKLCKIHITIGEINFNPLHEDHNTKNEQKYYEK